jgi:hypothetical protein
MNRVSSTLSKHFIKLFLLLFLLSHVVKAQEQTRSVIPPSPNAEAFAKYGNTPVSTYTGVADISIPIYEIKVRDITVPISLSYHASGIKVGEEASRVGLGWVLNAGGLISRNIVNLDDFAQTPQAFLSSTNVSGPIPLGPRNSPTDWTIFGTWYKYRDEAGNLQNLDLTQYINAQYDFEPDQYNYNFLGNAGKFVLDKYKNVLLEKQAKVRIVAASDGSSWEVTTQDGFVYRFADFEYFVDYDNTGGAKQKSAWYLTRITSPQNEQVDFHYNETASQYIITEGSYYDRIVPMILSCPGFACRAQHDIHELNRGKYYSNIALESITWSEGKVKFNIADDRQDITGERRISSVEIYKQNASAPYEEIVLSHDYFISSAAGGNSEFTSIHPNQVTKRLKLTGVTRRSLPVKEGDQPLEHKFSYYEDVQLPPKNSFARDHWGYFNGRFANTSLLPSYQPVVGSSNITSLIGVMGTEKDPSPDHVQAFSLKTITYPTKGSTTFYYGANEFEVSSSSTDQSEEPESYSESTHFLYNTSNKGVVQSTLFDLTNEYENDQHYTVPVTLDAAFRTSGTLCGNISGFLDVYFELYTENNLFISRVTPDITPCTPPNENACIKCNNSIVFEYKNTYNLKPGKYYWKAFMGASENQIVTISAIYTWLVDARKQPQSAYAADGSIIKYRTGPGLRISRIEDYDLESSQKVNVRKFSYGYKDDTNNDGVFESHSYGRRMVKPAYSYFNVARELDQDYTACYQCIQLVRDSGHPLANYNGNVIGYDKVIEYSGESGENGYTVYEYENVENAYRAHNYPVGLTGEYTNQLIPVRPPYTMTLENSKNGSLIRQTQFTPADQKVMMQENRFEPMNRTVMYGLESRSIDADAGMGTGYIFLLPYESVNSSFDYLAESTTTYYSQNSAPIRVARTRYAYENLAHLQLTRKTKDETNGRSTTTTYKYPADYSDAESNSVISLMKGDKFMHSLPVETTLLDVSSDGTQKIVHRDFTVYDNFGGLILPKEKYQLETNVSVLPADIPPYTPSGTINNQLYKKLFTLDYNSSGNIKKMQKTTDIPVAYLWGYSQTLPIAEIKNALAEDCYFTSFEEDGEVFTGTSGENQARTGEKVLPASTFTFPSIYAPNQANTRMSYWYWQNGKWNFSGIVAFQRTISTAGTKLDEVRAFPLGSQMSTFTHIPSTGISSQTDPNNITTFYQYDDLRRLKIVRDTDKKILKAYEYNYKQ